MFQKWEIECINNPKREYCIQKIKELILSKNNNKNPKDSIRSVLPETKIKFNFDSGIPVKDNFFSGFQIDTLFGILYLRKIFPKIDLKLMLDFPITTNEKLQEVYDELGLTYTHDFNFNNIMIYWIHQKIVFPQRFNENMKEYLTLSQKSKSTIAIIPIGIELSNGAHTNILYCDFNNMIFERFEPNGEKPPLSFNYNPDLLDSLIISEIRNSIGLDTSFKYLKPKDFLPSIGFSIIENVDNPKRKIGDPNGFCTVWCIWYCFQKLTTFTDTNKLNSKEFVKSLFKSLKLQNKNFKELIRNFSKNISELRDTFLSKFKLDINDWISYNYNESTLIEFEKEIINF